jgi:hypothetical protein
MDCHVTLDQENCLIVDRKTERMHSSHLTDVEVIQSL